MSKTTAEFLFANREKYPHAYNMMYVKLNRQARSVIIQKENNSSHYSDYRPTNVTCSGSGITKSPHPFSSIK
jgi:hypothetical protein